MKPTIAPMSIAEQGRKWAANARHQANQLREQQRRGERLCAQLAENPDLRRDAVAKRQHGTRAAVGLIAVQRLQEAANILHTGTAELARRAMPQPPADHGEAVRLRAEVEQMSRLPEHELAALLQSDRRARATFFGNATSIELRETSKNPVLNVEELQQQTLAEHAPEVAEAVADAKAAQRELLKVSGRLIAAGIHGSPMDADALPGANVQRNQVDHALRYAHLPPGWQADMDGVHIGDVNALASLAAHVFAEVPA